MIFMIISNIHLHHISAVLPRIFMAGMYISAGKNTSRVTVTERGGSVSIGTLLIF